MANEKDTDKVVEKPAEVKPEVNQEPKVEAKVVEKVDDDEEFINSLLEDVDTEKEVEDNEEQQRQKNKDAEEARKRRAAEAKAKADEEAAKKAELQAKVVAPTPAKPEEQVKPQPDVNKLGQQLVDFKSKYPEMDLSQLDADKAFKKYIDGKLLGKKDFTALYEEYVELKAEITGVEQKVVRNNYQKAQSSSGSSVSPVANRGEVYSEEELRKLASRLPTMNPKEASKIEEKLKKSIAYYDSKK
jgi:colicin import membrane protein